MARVCRCGANIDSLGSHLRVRLTLICEECVYSDELVTKNQALSLARGLRGEDLKQINCFDKTNPSYRSGPRKYVYEEVLLLKSVVRATAERETKSKDVKENQAKKARLDCFNSRLVRLDGLVPTPGLVSGDFCSTRNKRPKIGTKLLAKRRALWNRCAGVDIPTSVQVFIWATSNKKLDTTVPDALLCIYQERHLLDRIATVEGHRVLEFLNQTERLALLRINDTFEESRNGLPVKTMTPELLGLCEKLADRMNTPFDRVVAKLDESKDCWFYKYLHRMTLRRLSCILAPHFLGSSAKRAMLIRDRDESFSRWGLPWSDEPELIDYGVDYARNDIVDVELYSASRYLSKYGIPMTGLKVIESRVMNEPGLTWMNATKAYVEKELVARRSGWREGSERIRMSREDKFVYMFRHCRCGSLAAKQCVFTRCGNCCEGPCARHGSM